MSWLSFSIVEDAFIFALALSSACAVSVVALSSFFHCMKAVSLASFSIFFWMSVLWWKVLYVVATIT